MGLRRREGSRSGLASHETAEARLECTARAYAMGYSSHGLVHSAKRDADGQSPMALAQKENAHACEIVLRAALDEAAAGEAGEKASLLV